VDLPLGFFLLKTIDLQILVVPPNAQERQRTWPCVLVRFYVQSKKMDQYG
jgi:hypothetical protein